MFKEWQSDRYVYISDEQKFKCGGYFQKKAQDSEPTDSEDYFQDGVIFLGK